MPDLIAIHTQKTLAVIGVLKNTVGCLSSDSHKKPCQPCGIGFRRASHPLHRLPPFFPHSLHLFTLIPSEPSGDCSTYFPSMKNNSTKEAGRKLLYAIYSINSAKVFTANSRSQCLCNKKTILLYSDTIEITEDICHTRL